MRPSRTPARRTRLATALALGLLAAALAGTEAGRAQSSVERLQNDIRRWGCDLPRYADSVAGCRDLHARLRHLQGLSASADARAPAESPRAESPRRPAPPSSAYASPGVRTWSAPPRSIPAPAAPRGLFGVLFGGPSRPVELPRLQESDEYGFPRPRPATYRTLCVRLCDGYYWPISFSTIRDRFASDDRQCQSGCAAPARLFVHRNPGADVEDMVDLAGRPYAALPTAFRHRKEYVADCRCKPEPWSEEAIAEYEARERTPPEQAVAERPAPRPVHAERPAAPPPTVTARTRLWSSPTPPATPRFDSQRAGGEWRYPFFPHHN